MKIYTHKSVDLDAVMSVWILKRFGTDEIQKADVEFVPANWDGSGMRDDDIAVDINAGGKGIKGRKTEGRIHSCAEVLSVRYMPTEDLLAMHDVLEFVDLHDTRQNPLRHKYGADADKIGDLSVISLPGILRALRSYHKEEDSMICQRMFEILDGTLIQSRQFRVMASMTNQGVEIVSNCVAITRATPPGNLFRQGMQFVIYVNKTGMGILRRDGIDMKVAAPQVKALIVKHGEEDEWFEHPSGFLYARGSRKAPISTPSKIDPMDLAKAVADSYLCHLKRKGEE